MNDVPRGTADILARLAELVLAENEHQNLISAKSAADIFTRHIDDSLQLLTYDVPGALIDIGTGAGFPGLVLAACRSGETVLVEPRARRADFLRRAIEALELHGTVVIQSRIEMVTAPKAAIITARAVASLDRLFGAAMHLADKDTRWVLPKGRSAQSELDAALQTWQGKFELVPSRTDPASVIVLATRVRRRHMA